MKPLFAFVIGLSLATAVRRNRQARSLVPRRPLESDPILSVAEYEEAEVKAAAERRTRSDGFSRRLVVKFVDEAHLRVDGTQSVTSLSNHACASEVSRAAAFLGTTLLPMFEEDLLDQLDELADRAETMSGVQQPDMRGLVKVDLEVQDAEHLVAAATAFDSMKCVEYVSIVSVDPPKLPEQREPTIQQNCHSELPAGGGIPDFSARQGYLRPGQLDADYLHSLGADGSGIRYSDCEFSVNFQHQEFRNANLTEESGYPVHDPYGYADHGTASMGLTLGGNEFGIKGLANKAESYFFSEEPASGIWNRERAVAAAMTKSRPGDVVLLEMQIGDPYGPAELTQGVWVVVKMGTDAGVVVVGAAGNGNANLDSSDYASYRARGDSGAIIVGAGTPAHEKAYFSTHGSRVDVQAWGDHTVMTAGYGKCTGFPGYNVRGSRYTYQYSGTSSASAIVAGAVTLFQSWALRELGAPLPPSELRNLLRGTGHPQTGSSADGSVGNHINLREAVEYMRNPTPTPEPTARPTTGPVCVDLQDSCPYWAGQGYCDPSSIYYAYMEQNCCLSCGFGA